MGILSDHKFTFTSSALSDDAFGVVEFNGREGLSMCYEFDVVLVSEQNDIDLDDVLNSRATFTIKRDAGDAPFHGVLKSFEQTRFYGDYTFYRAVLVPKLWLLTLTYHNQVVLDEKLPDILKTVLKDGGLISDDFRISLQSDYEPLEYVCQYNETHFDFISRWMERNGIYYYFEQGESAEKLIITDSKTAHQGRSLGRTLTYSGPSGLDALHRDEVVHRFTCRMRQVPKSLRLKDYNYRQPSLELDSRAQVFDQGFGEVYIYGEHYKEPEEGEALAKIRSEELLCHRAAYSGESSVPFIQPGFLFDLEKHFRGDYNRGYLIRNVEHRGSQVAYLTAGLRNELGRLEKAPRYANSFTAIPDDVQFRPQRRTPKPVISGTISAHVDAEGSGQYAELDDQGRYKIRLPFDKAGRAGGKASKPIRMMQPYGGPGYGFHCPLHKDSEVLLTFVEGDPDRPIIASAVPNPDTPSPVTSANQTKSALHTSAGNRMEMEDKEGERRLLMHTPHSNTFLRLGAHNDPGDEHDDEEEDDGFAWSTEGNMFHSGLGNYEVKIWGAETEFIGGGKELLVGGVFSKNCIGVETSFNIGGGATFNWPKHRLCIKIGHEHILEEKTKLLDKHMKAADKEITLAESKIAAGNEKDEALNDNLELVDHYVGAVNEKLEGTGDHIEAIDSKIEAINSKSEALEAQIETSQETVDAMNLAMTKADFYMKWLENHTTAATNMIGQYEFALEVERLSRIGGAVMDE